MEIALCPHSLYLLARAATLQPVCCMLVAAIYLAGSNTENMKGFKVSVFCCLPAGPGVLALPVSKDAVSPSTLILSYSYPKANKIDDI